MSIKENLNKETLVVAGMILLAALSRIVPHPINVAPFAAVALFAAVYIENKVLVFSVPLLSLVLSDAVLSIIQPDYQFGLINFVLYGAFALTVLIGLLLKKRVQTATIVAASLGSSVLFYLTTNFAVWAGWNMYPKTFDGLVQCYIAAIPFFRYTALGDLLYSTILFGSFAFVHRTVLKPVRQEQNL